MQLSNFDIDSLEEYTSKSKLAFILQVSSATMGKYCNIAMLIADFEADYPSMVHGSKPHTGAGLTKYQVWVIYKLMLICRRIARAWVENCLENETNPQFAQQFSKEEYLKCRNEYHYSTNGEAVENCSLAVA